MKAREIMSSPAITIPETATLEHAAKLMTDKHIGGLPVVDADGRLVGFITDSDFAAKEQGVPFSLFRAPQVLGHWLGREGIERIYESARNLLVRDFMSRPPIWANEDDPIDRVARLMMERDVNRVVIARDGRPVGIVARHDLLRLLVQGKPSPSSG